MLLLIALAGQGAIAATALGCDMGHTPAETTAGESGHADHPASAPADAGPAPSCCADGADGDCPMQGCAGAAMPSAPLLHPERPVAAVAFRYLASLRLHPLPPRFRPPIV